MTIITDSAEYIIFKNVRFEATTVGYLSGYGADAYNSITRFGDHLVFATRNSEGESLAAIYEFAEESYEDFGRTSSFLSPFCLLLVFSGSLI